MASSVWTWQINTLTDGELLFQINSSIIISHLCICPPVASAWSILSHFHKSQRSCRDPGMDCTVRTAVIYSKAMWQVKTYENENSWGLEFKNCFKRRNGHLDTLYRFVEWNARNDTDVRRERRELLYNASFNLTSYFLSVRAPRCAASGQTFTGCSSWTLSMTNVGCGCLCV